MEGETQTLFVACPGREALLVLVTNTSAILKSPLRNLETEAHATRLDKTADDHRQRQC